MIDDRKSIAKHYVRSWFAIDLVSILPMDLILLLIYDNTNSTAHAGMMRVTKISKLYKLMKITRLVRLFKLMKNKGQIVKKLGNALKLG